MFLENLCNSVVNVTLAWLSRFYCVNCSVRGVTKVCKGAFYR
nr:MAG TPA: protein of unknown function (DUF3973) [Caudoviricetes sp.]